MQDYWQEIATLERRMDDMLRGLGTRAFLASPSLPLFVRKPFAPAMDVFKRDDDLVVRMELPGSIQTRTSTSPPAITSS